MDAGGALAMLLRLHHPVSGFWFGFWISVARSSGSGVSLQTHCN
jgi:hypothetical protein